MIFQLNHVSLSVTQHCNLKCSYCGTVNNSEKDLTLSEIRSIVREISDLGTVAEISLTGGEPTLRNDLPDILEYAHNLGVPIVISSNGFLLDKASAINMKKAGLKMCSVSIDGSQELHDRIRGIHGSYQNAIEGIIRLKSECIPVRVRTTLIRQNLDCISDIIRKCVEMEVEGYSLRRVLPLGKADSAYSKISVSPQQYIRAVLEAKELCEKEHIKLYISDPVLLHVLGRTHEIQNRYGSLEIFAGCAAGIAACHIDCAGNVTPCSSLLIGCGNIKETPLKQIWQDSLILKRLRERDLVGRCGSCEFKYVCGGCRAAAYGTDEDLNASDPFCFARTNFQTS